MPAPATAQNAAATATSRDQSEEPVPLHHGNRLTTDAGHRRDGRQLPSQPHENSFAASPAGAPRLPGATWFDRSCWGGPYNAESKLLSFGHAFDDLGLARIALRTDNLNVRPQQALTRLALVHEGTLRSHKVRQDGTRRDSPYYSVLADEWPSLRDKLLTRVAAKATV
ncbi:GNAT family N-acetyltransferase [Streptomyces sp. NPDC056165]|uniref:GNAT family N-acetyltransferase n=1 Tax=Streptomyces sp. NPDC056165 TaxID=3345733 RepID=UPI0035E2CCC0